MRDSQRSKLYCAERQVFNNEMYRLPGYVDCALYIKSILSSAWFLSRYGNKNVIAHPKEGRACSTYVAETPIRITIPKWAFTKWVMLHELAHVAITAGEHHGRLFARTYIEMVKRFIGREQGELLKKSFRAFGVKYCAKRKSNTTRVMPEAALIALKAYRERKDRENQKGDL